MKIRSILKLKHRGQPRWRGRHRVSEAPRRGTPTSALFVLWTPGLTSLWVGAVWAREAFLSSGTRPHYRFIPGSCHPQPPNSWLSSLRPYPTYLAARELPWTSVYGSVLNQRTPPGRLPRPSPNFPACPSIHLVGHLSLLYWETLRAGSLWALSLLISL